MFIRINLYSRTNVSKFVELSYFVMLLVADKIIERVVRKII